MPAIPSAARRATRVIDSESDSEAVDELDDDHGDSDVSEIEEAEPEPEPEPEPERPKIRLRMPARKPQRSTRTAAIKASARAVAQAQASAKEEEEEEDELDEEEEEEAEDVDVEEEEVEEESGSRAPSPSKMTARQRARLTEGESHLMALPDGFSKPKPELTEAERLQKREEMARRRKRQNEQRLQDEQDQTINRLLRAQTGRSRTKLDDTDTPRSGQVSPVKARVVPDAVRWVSRMHGEDVVLRVGVKAGREAWIAVGEEHVPRFEAAEPGDLVCAAQGCALPRKYRSVGKPSVGGCSVAHLKEVNARVARGEL
ncbi:hypothetical protein CC85DRAFT_285584 [Cutaneotrichosporon oleaginosum]|uniref:INO80 complex subunit B-like conserved region domain-containing protein n=1 Tax=Cutaneotrichosporon oleaginosum TaxID=879819 RepID=A0A0J0XMG9_9TREE|nr:uncharacterized protein CC85DRAFT_285584 [Cutaneotrichosporon oleaginosum]KLT42345.1 hypothetical protein CC85DRAFT_285584 [Cutaneotrichosporon oleaginosum]TXT04165.1 hypothetical protein COLE_07862 [Cutaneotrichosporon oleaginosum]